jgi:hypothetical protein
MDKLLASYKVLSHLATQVLFFIEVHETYSDNQLYLNQVKFKGHYSNMPLAKAISGSLLNYSLIICNSFFDEYNEEFTSSKHPKYADRINRLKKITKPVIKRLRKWTDFKNYRNHLLAHNLRVNGVSIFDTEFLKKDYKIPHTNTEIILLANMMKIITYCISLEFPELVENINWTENILSKTNFDIVEVDIEKEIAELWTQINKAKSSLA